jgi:hypothetical protein
MRSRPPPPRCLAGRSSLLALTTSSSFMGPRRPTFPLLVPDLRRHCRLALDPLLLLLRCCTAGLIAPLLSPASSLPPRACHGATTSPRRHSSGCQRLLSSPLLVGAAAPPDLFPGAVSAQRNPTTSAPSPRLRSAAGPAPLRHRPHGSRCRPSLVADKAAFPPLGAGARPARQASRPVQPSSSRRQPTPCPRRHSTTPTFQPFSVAGVDTSC